MTDLPPAADRPDARSFCGRVPWPLVAELADGDEVASAFLVRECRRLQTKAGQPYLRLLLGDRSGAVEAVLWDEAERWEPHCAVGRAVGARGRVSLYQDRLQLRVTSIQPLEVADREMDYLLPTSRRPRELMERELDAQIASVRDRPLRGLLRRCLGRDTGLGRAFRLHPAATRNHHAYLAGLLEHTLSVTAICDRLVEHYAEQGIRLDRDLLITGALLHDIGKTAELEALPTSAYTTPGRLLGHIVIGIQLVEREGRAVQALGEERLLLVLHLIASHQGKPEWDSPRVPQTLEALVLHYADDLDAKTNQAFAALDGVGPGEWSDYDRSLGRSLYLPHGPDRKPGDPGTDPDDVIDLFRG